MPRLSKIPSRSTEHMVYSPDALVNEGSGAIWAPDLLATMSFTQRRIEGS